MQLENACVFVVLQIPTFTCLFLCVQVNVAHLPTANDFDNHIEKRKI